MTNGREMSGIGKSLHDVVRLVALEMSVVCFVRSGYLEVSNDEDQEVKDCDEQIRYSVPGS